MTDALEALFDAPYKDLAAPNASFVSVARAIEADSYHSPLPFAPLRQHRSNVGTMMLDRETLRNSKRQGMRCRGVLRVGIVDDKQFLRSNLIHRDQILDRFLKRAQRLVMPQVPDVLTHKRLPIDNQCDCIFQVGADSQNRPPSRQSRHGTGSIAPSAPNDDWAKHSIARHRVIHSSGNRALSNQESVRDAREPV